MKAFDVITASHYKQEKQRKHISQRQHIFVDQKEQIAIPIKTKFETQPISQELRKPKVHLIKPKQPQIHIIDPKAKFTLRFDTQIQEWSNAPPQVIHPSGDGGFFNIFRGNRNQIFQQQIHPQPIIQSRNPFDAIRQHFSRQPIAPNTSIEQQNLQINLLNSNMNQEHSVVNPFQMHANLMQSEMQRSEVRIVSQERLNPPILPVERQNFQQSHVQRVQLQNIQQSFNREENNGFVSKILNFFKSSTSQHAANNINQQNPPINSQIQRPAADSLGYLDDSMSSAPKKVQNKIPLQISEVENYRQSQHQLQSSFKKIKFEESIVEEYYQRK